MDKKEKEELDKQYGILYHEIEMMKEQIASKEYDLRQIKRKLNDDKFNNLNRFIGKYIEYDGMYMFVKDVRITNYDGIMFIGPNISFFNEDTTFISVTKTTTYGTCNKYIPRIDLIKEITEDEFFSVFDRSKELLIKEIDSNEVN